jgi:hypothetical protein
VAIGRKHGLRWQREVAPEHPFDVFAV